MTSPVYFAFQISGLQYLWWSRLVKKKVAGSYQSVAEQDNEHQISPDKQLALCMAAIICKIIYIFLSFVLILIIVTS